MPGSIPDRPCRPSRSEIPAIFTESRENTGYDPLKRFPTDGTSPADPSPTCGQLALILQPNT